MEVTLDKIVCKPNDFKICKSCGGVNWYENKSCINCSKETFLPIGKGVEEYIDNDYEFYKSEGYTEEQIDNIYTEV